MKFAILPILGCLLFGGVSAATGTVNEVYAAVEEENVFVEQTYNYEDEVAKYTITLTSETEYSLETENKETNAKMTLTGLYAINEDKLTLYEGNSTEALYSFTIGEDGKTLTTITESNEEDTYPCEVILNDYDYGTVYVDKEYGEVGDIVTLHATPSILCEIVEISVNGMVLTANEDGNYTFVLVEGENIVKALFQVSNEQVSDILNLVKSLEETSWEDLFTIENLIILITFLLTTVFGSGLLIQLLKNKNTSDKLAESVNALFENETLEKITSITKEFLEEKFGPSFEKISDEMASLDTVARTMANCFLLSQENTPESRLAIAKELTKLSETRKDLAEEVKAIINSQKEQLIAEELEKKKAIEELEKANESLTEKINDTSSTSEGRY